MEISLKRQKKKKTKTVGDIFISLPCGFIQALISRLLAEGVSPSSDGISFTVISSVGTPG